MEKTMFYIESKKYDSCNVSIPSSETCGAIIESIAYQNWFRSSNDSKAILVESIADIGQPPSDCECIPIGSIDFTLAYLEKFHNLPSELIHPINVPTELFQFAGRELANKNIATTTKTLKPVIVKSNAEIKGFQLGLQCGDTYPLGPIQESQIVNILSEFRCFVYGNTLIDIKRYLGNPFIAPNEQAIQEIIQAYSKNSPPAYTLDVYINEKKETHLMEINAFWSCGIYGLGASDTLLNMYKSAIHWQINQAKAEQKANRARQGVGTGKPNVKQDKKEKEQ